MTMPQTAFIGDPTAVMGRRIGAYIFDLILTWIIVAVAFLLFLSETTNSTTRNCTDADAPAICVDTGNTIYFASDGNETITLLLPMGIWLLMGIAIQGTTGATPGKHLAGLRVVDQATGQQVGVGKAAARTAMWIVDAIPFLVPLVGLITGLATKGHRRVGDMVAGTLVVHKNTVGTPPAVPGLSAPVGSTFAPPPPGGGFSPPPPTGAAVLETAAAETGDGIEAPKWDADRGAYIQWDKEQQKWMTYDDAAGTWEPLS